MTKKIKTSIEIHASRETVWNILTDFENYPEWNPFILSLTGDVKIGNRIRIKLQGMTFKPVVLVCDENSEFKWLGHLLLKGLIDGEHRFKLTEDQAGTTIFEQSENFSGLLVGPFSKMLDKTKIGFVQMNEALKVRAENR